MLRPWVGFKAHSADTWSGGAAERVAEGLAGHVFEDQRADEVGVGGVGVLGDAARRVARVEGALIMLLRGGGDSGDGLGVELGDQLDEARPRWCAATPVGGIRWAASKTWSGR